MALLYKNKKNKHIVVDSSNDYWFYFKATIPKKHKKTDKPPPDFIEDIKCRDISSGIETPDNINSWKDNLVGVFFWCVWAVVGVYSWWFTEINFLWYGGALVGWFIIFMYTLTLLPVRYKKLSDKYGEENV